MPRDHHHTDEPEPIVLRDGTKMIVRRLRQDDLPRLARFAERLSPEALRLRFFTPVKHLAPGQLEHLVDVDFQRRAAFVAVFVEDDEVRAVGRMAAESDIEAEVAFTVEDAYQGKGIATELLHHLAAFARDKGYERFSAMVLGENREMIEVFEHCGYPMRQTWQGNTARITLDIRARGQAGDG